MDQYPRNYLYRRIVQSKLFIDAHYADAIDIDNISNEAYFSKFHFIRLFKEIYEKTPHQYLIAVRINHAITFLKQGFSVSEVCSSVGFESLTSFSTLFKRTVGVSPSNFVLQEQLRKKQVADKPLLYIPGCFALKHEWTKDSNFEEGSFESLTDL
ncbi:MAG: helix-turn-helix transcriptional regulator [Cytophaga sp.]|uniref:helix-turn-helix transcriptional regulator n=1 Tax=Cytophaga sp. TaxID=29535 RepID=UPI003F804C13